MLQVHSLFAYVGPETFLPVSSLVAMALGVVMMLGRTIVGTALKWLPIRARRAPQRRPHVPSPHFPHVSPEPAEVPQDAGSAR